MGEKFDVVIAGGGAAGLSLALALKVTAGKALSVAVCDPAMEGTVRGDTRAYAIVAGARRFFEACGAWEAMAAEAEPILGMDITDSALEEPVRPLFLDFDTGNVEGEPYAHMLPNRVILEALAARVRARDIVVIPAPVSTFERRGGWVDAVAGARSLSARLLVAADGKASRLRDIAGISFYGWPYRQSGIAGAIRHSLPHEGRAIEHFLPSGPFALLPLKGNRSSIVWTEETGAAERFLRLHPDDLLAEIEKRAAGRFGTVSEVSDLAAFPLSLGIARHFVAERFALLGDAAHAMHPIAGQGLNYGLRGAAALAETILDAARLGLDIGSELSLEPYEASRRGDVVRMLAATDGLNRLFSNDSHMLRATRDFGLGVVERMPALKKRFMAEAAGSTASAPRAFRGLAL